LSSKILTHDKDHFAKLAVDAILRLKGSGNLEMVQLIEKPGGSLKDSFLDEGFILDKKFGVGQPKRIENAKILIANTGMDTDKIKIYGARVRVDSMTKVAEIEDAEKLKMRNKCEKIIAHGCNVFINRQLIYNYPEQIFADAGVAAIEHADFEGVERLALVTGGDILSTFDTPESAKLGECDLIEEIMIGEDRLIKFSGVAKGEACTIVLRGASTHILAEAERSLHDALCVLNTAVKDSRVICGGGCAEMIMSKAVEQLAEKTPGKRSLAMECFAKALRCIPSIICDNAGLDSGEIVSQLRARHAEGETISPESKPALSQIIDGMRLNALAKHSIASERFPGVFSASCSTALDMIISAHPPPQITRESLTAVFNTHNASCRERSASAKICVDAPLKTIVHASPFATPENLIKRSSPIIISSIKSHSPNFADSGVSNVLKISPPVTKANRSTPSKSACSIAATPASAKICSG
jgi:hypothetical protein